MAQLQSRNSGIVSDRTSRVTSVRNTINADRYNDETYRQKQSTIISDSQKPPMNFNPKNEYILQKLIERNPM